MRIVWTHYGRPHPGADAVAVAIARAVARRWGGCARSVETAFRERIGVAIAAMALRMSLATFSRGGQKMAPVC